MRSYFIFIATLLASNYSQADRLYGYDQDPEASGSLPFASLLVFFFLLWLVFGPLKNEANDNPILAFLAILLLPIITGIVFS